jgi:hypothetical protein
MLTQRVPAVGVAVGQVERGDFGFNLIQPLQQFFNFGSSLNSL